MSRKGRVVNFRCREGYDDDIISFIENVERVGRTDKSEVFRSVFRRGMQEDHAPMIQYVEDVKSGIDPVPNEYALDQLLKDFT